MEKGDFPLFYFYRALGWGGTYIWPKASNTRGVLCQKKQP